MLYTSGKVITLSVNDQSLSFRLSLKAGREWELGVFGERREDVEGLFSQPALGFSLDDFETVSD